MPLVIWTSLASVTLPLKVMPFLAVRLPPSVMPPGPVRVSAPAARAALVMTWLAAARTSVWSMPPLMALLTVMLPLPAGLPLEP